ncbi:MAG: hypothetical protein ACR2QO_16415 [Acidimicrobiales bacterium]
MTDASFRPLATDRTGPGLLSTAAATTAAAVALVAIAALPIVGGLARWLPDGRA